MTTTKQTSCSVSGCERPLSAKGYCSPHYYQAHGRKGRPGRKPGAIRIVGDSEARLDGKFVRGRADECWEWTGARDQHGYGCFWLDGRLVKAPRAMWEMRVGSVPKGQWVLHKCDNPPCVNPRHLFLGTRLDNIKDMRSKGRGRGNPRPPCLGEKHRNAKMTWKRAALARKLHAKGASLSGLARRFGVTPPTMWALLHGKTWKVA